jgi:hypothetical protein
MGGGLPPTGGQTGAGGSLGTGGAEGSGGVPSVGGTTASGGTMATGGTIATGGTTATGGTIATGGTTATGGTIATGGTTASGGTPGVGGTPGAGGSNPGPCDNVSPALGVTLLSTTAIAALGRPFSTNSSDLTGPSSWATQYGKSPEIIPSSDGNSLDVLFQDQDSGALAYVVRIVQSGNSYVVQAAYEVESLGRVMGFTKDSSGNYYVATGVDEDSVVNASYPPNDIHRQDIVRIVKFDTSGCVLMESDVDIERGNASSGSEILVNPMVAASSRLAWGGDRLALVHGHNTEPDANIGGTRHQKAITTHINALTGAATRTASMWVSHSFDQRVLYDGTGFVELHLGDAYPRYVALGRYTSAGGSGPYPVYHIKGELGANNTYTRLGGIVQTTDATYGYLALFATERSTTASTSSIGGTRDLALVRIEGNFASQNTSDVIIEGAATGASSQTVTSSGTSRTNYVRWLTNLGAQVHAERPRIVHIGGGEYVVLFERWSGDGATFDGTFALLVSGAGAVLAGPTEVPGDYHLGRGDDIATLGGRAVYVTGSTSALHLNFVDGDLVSERITLN